MKSGEDFTPERFDIDKVEGIDAGIGFIDINNPAEREVVEKVWLSPATTYWFKSVYTKEDTLEALAEEAKNWVSASTPENFVAPMLKPPLSLTREEMLERFGAGGSLTIGVYDPSPENEKDCKLVGLVIIGKDADERVSQLKELPDVAPVFKEAAVAREEPLVLEISYSSLPDTKRGLMSQASRLILKGVMEKLAYKELPAGDVKRKPIVIAGYIQQKPKPEWLYPDSVVDAEKVNTPAVRLAESMGMHYAGEVFYDERSRIGMEQGLCRPDRCFVLYNMEDVAKAVDARVWDDLTVR